MEVLGADEAMVTDVEPSAAAPMDMQEPRESVLTAAEVEDRPSSADGTSAASSEHLGPDYVPAQLETCGLYGCPLSRLHSGLCAPPLDAGGGRRERKKPKADK